MKTKNTLYTDTHPVSPGEMELTLWEALAGEEKRAFQGGVFDAAGKAFREMFDCSEISRGKVDQRARIRANTGGIMVLAALMITQRQGENPDVPLEWYVAFLSTLLSILKDARDRI